MAGLQLSNSPTYAIKMKLNDLSQTFFIQFPALLMLSYSGLLVHIILCREILQNAKRQCMSAVTGLKH